MRNINKLVSSCRIVIHVSVIDLGSNMIEKVFGVNLPAYNRGQPCGMRPARGMILGEYATWWVSRQRIGIRVVFKPMKHWLPHEGCNNPAVLYQIIWVTATSWSIIDALYGVKKTCIKVPLLLNGLQLVYCCFFMQ